MSDSSGLVSEADRSAASAPASVSLRTPVPAMACPPAATAAALRPGSRSTFWFAFWLGVALVAAKAAHLGLPGFSSGGLKQFAHDLTVISNADMLFAFVVGLAAQIVVLYSARSVALERIAWGLLIVFCLVCVVYAIVSVQIFAYLRSPLSYPLIYLAGDVKNMRSSVTRFASPRMVAAVVVMPIAYLAATWATHRLIQPKRTRGFRVAQLLCFVALTGLVCYGRAGYPASWGDRDDHRIAENPHWTLFASCVDVLFAGERTVQMDDAFPPEDLADFRPVSERADELQPLEFPHRPRNVIVLVMESTSTQYLNIYRGPFEGVTPRLKEEAAHSLVFDNFHCHVGLTANALVAISLSVYPGMTWREYTVEHPRLRGRTAAEVLRPAGYRTAFIHNGDLNYVNQSGFLRGRGFDDLWDYRNLAGGLPDPNDFSWGVADRHLVDGILKWIDQDAAARRPFFVLSWTIQAHHPYTLPVENKVDFFKGKLPPGDYYDLDLYLNALNETDREIGRLFDGLRERGLADDTLVVITGDHGEAFGHPHDSYGHGGKLYQENVNVPLVLWNPKMFDGRRSDAIGSQIDLNPTVFHVLGIDPAGSWQGQSLFTSGRPRAYFYAANDDYLLGVREGRWKYIYNATTGRDVLYDLVADPQEQENAAKGHTDVCDRLRKRLAAWLKYEDKHLATLHTASVDPDSR